MIATLLTDARRSYRFDVRQFHRMMASGIFGDQKVELVAGRVFPLTDQPPHVFAVETIHDSLRTMLPQDRWTIREEKPILMSRFWNPKPDLAVARGSRTTFASRLPRARDVALLTEVSDTTYHRDRGSKWRRYASAGIPVYQIVRLRGADTVVEVWTNPTGRGKAARYNDVVVYSARAGESVPIDIDGSHFGQFAVSELLPR
ncbi:MAG: Uma2 family endonuclease [Isosphaeraceae bacterium]